MSVEIAISQQTPIVTFAETPLSVEVVDANTIIVESSPLVGVVQYTAVKGDPGTDGITPDFADPGTVADMLAALSGQVTNTQLHSSLLSSIEKIDVGPSSLEARAALLEYADAQLNASIAQDALRITASEQAIAAQSQQLVSLGSDLITLDGRVTGNSAAIDSLETQVIANEADIFTQAQQITGISARVDIVEDNQTAQAAIVNQNTAAITVIDGDITSTAETLSTITAGVGGMTAAIQLKNEVIAGTTKPLYAQNTVKLDVNGKVSGYGLASTDTSSVFEILADRFAVTNGLNSGIVPFLVDGPNVYIQNGFIQNAAIDAAKIANATITTAKIANAQITNALIADAQINTAKIVDGTITTAKIGDAQISGAKIANATITDANIANLSAGKISAGSLAISWNGGSVYSNKTWYGGAPGFWFGSSGGVAYMDIGNSTNYLRWDGSQLLVGGNIIATGNIQDGAVTSQHVVESSDVSLGRNVPSTWSSGASYNAATLSNVVTTGKQVVIIPRGSLDASVFCNLTTDTLAIYAYRDATLVSTLFSQLLLPGGGGATVKVSTSIGGFVTDTPPAGTYTYYLRVYIRCVGATGDWVKVVSPGLFTLECKR